MAKRVQIVVMLLAVGIVAAMLAGSSSARSPGKNVARDTMPADKAETWKALLADKDFDGILKLEFTEIEKNTKSSGLFNRNWQKVQRAAGVVALLGNAGTLTREGDDARKCAALRDAARELAKAAKAKKF